MKKSASLSSSVMNPLFYESNGQVFSVLFEKFKLVLQLYHLIEFLEKVNLTFTALNLKKL